MDWKIRLARVAARVESVLERVFPRKHDPAVIDAYVGYATPETLVLRGRVLGPRGQVPAQPTNSRWRNFRQMVHLFRTNEMAGVEVRAGDAATRSDEEGYFTLEVPRGSQTGLIQVDVEMAGKRFTCPVNVPATEARIGVISDIDDTMIVTGAHSLLQNLWTSLTGNVETRKVFPDAVHLIETLCQDGRNPVFFVSSSPWNFHGFLMQVFNRAGLPKAPMFLRDYGISRTQFITGTHGDHKGESIDTILAAEPDLPFVLIGDTGQHDAQIYAVAAARHPGRIAHVVLRQARDGVDTGDAVAIARLKALAVPVTVSKDYAQAISELAGIAEHGISS